MKQSKKYIICGLISVSTQQTVGMGEINSEWIRKVTSKGMAQILSSCWGET